MIHAEVLCQRGPNVKQPMKAVYGPVDTLRRFVQKLAREVREKILTTFGGKATLTTGMRVIRTFTMYRFFCITACGAIHSQTPLAHDLIINTNKMACKLLFLKLPSAST